MNVEDYNYPVNLGNNMELSIKEIAEKIKKQTNSKSEIIYQELPEDDPKKRCPDITLAIKLFKWQPKITLEEGLTKSIRWYKEQLNAEK